MHRSKSELFLMILGLSLIFLYGCTVRTYTVEKPRVDTEITGNQGCLSGSCDPEKRDSQLSEMRKTTVVEVELKHKEDKKVAQEEAQVQEEAYPEEPVEIFEEAPILEDDIILEEPESSVYEEVEERYEEERTYVPEPKPQPVASGKSQYKIYTVQKNDTLQKISYKFYNTTRSWKKIFDANKDILKSPDSIYPGQVLKVPVE